MPLSSPRVQALRDHYLSRMLAKRCWQVEYHRPIRKYLYARFVFSRAGFSTLKVWWKNLNSRANVRLPGGHKFRHVRTKDISISNIGNTRLPGGVGMWSGWSIPALRIDNQKFISKKLWRYPVVHNIIFHSRKYPDAGYCWRGHYKSVRSIKFH